MSTSPPGNHVPSVQDREFLVGIVERFCPEVENPEKLSIHRLLGRIANRKAAAEFFIENHVPLHPLPPGVAHFSAPVVKSRTEAEFILEGDALYRERLAARKRRGLGPE